MKTLFLPAFSQAVALLWVLFLPACLFAQLVDDFSDGDFSQNPPWTGSVSRFVVEQGVLQLRDTAPAANNTAYLSVYAPTSLNDTTTWTFFFSLHFAPSASNYARFYLGASYSDLSAPLQGYFLKLGGASGDTDALELYRQDGTNTVLLCSGPAGALALEPAQARIKVSRSPQGQWSLWADYSGGNNWLLQAQASDTTYALQPYAGLYCRYTSSRSSAFFWDEVEVSPIYQDTDPPAILEVLPQSPFVVGIRFSEPVDSLSAVQATNYTLQPGNNATLAVAMDSADAGLVWLLFSEPLANGATYNIAIDSIADLHLNWASGLLSSFVFYFVEEAQSGDLIITEIMADPSPPQVLPNAEYIELFNRSNKVIQLEAWTFSAGSSTCSLPSKLLLPGDFLVLCEKSAASLFNNNTNILGIEDFPVLTNSGTTLRLADSEDNEQAALTYSSVWYANAYKEDGGWSLELINFDAPIDCAGNWSASIHPEGGTPGAPNSLPHQAADTLAPVLLSAVAGPATEIVLTFDERITLESITPEAFVLSSGIQIVEVLHSASNLTLMLDAPLQPGQTYTLTLAPELSDCMGNKLGQNIQIEMGLSELPDSGDIIINELLFNPHSGGSDFVELVNRSEKIINLKGLRLLNTYNGQSEIIENNRLLLPGAYVVLTKDKNDLQDRYFVLSPAQVFEQPLPGFDDDRGTVVLKSGLITLDSFDYQDSYHSPLIVGSANGISLERLRIAGETNEPSNWHSAAGTVGFATPTAVNSQAIITTLAEDDGVLSLYNTVFSPDADGWEDVLLLRVSPHIAGAVLNLVVFDARGRRIRRLARNELLANENDYKWDGVTEDGTLAAMGIYILWAEIFNPQGQVKRYIKSCVLAKKLK